MEELRAEFPGILTWAVRGCLAWQRDGLVMPSAVREGTERWRHFADVIKRFVTECCELDPPGRGVRLRDLRALPDNCCGEHKELPQSQAGFKIKLTELDLTQQHTRKGNVWYGIGLKA